MPLSRACLHSLVTALLALTLAGCISRPPASYRRVDPETTEFKAAVARETAVETAKGQSMSEAAKTATQRVTQQTIVAEKKRRIENVAPLTAALAALDRPRGCWAYTATTTTTRSPEGPVVEVERFDPFQPEERIWTLITRNGAAPTDDEQATYRRARLKKWKRQQATAAKRKPTPERVERNALYADLTVTHPADPGGPATYTFRREAVKITLLGEIPASLETNLIDEAQARVVHRSQQTLAPFSYLAGTIKIEAFDLATDYTVVDPAVAPFPAKSVAHLRMKSLGSDLRDITTETVYSDYRRVKCYEDRFEVQIGPSSFQDFLPEAR